LSTGAFPAPDSKAWAEFYRAAIFEADQSRRAERIRLAETVASQRKRDLGTCEGDHIEEEHALDDALYVLRVLRTTSREQSAD
jgi:hypothetical protein